MTFLEHQALRSDIDQLAGYCIAIASHYPKADESLEFSRNAIATVQRVRNFILGKLV